MKKQKGSLEKRLMKKLVASEIIIGLIAVGIFIYMLNYLHGWDDSVTNRDSIVVRACAVAVIVVALAAGVVVLVIFNNASGTDLFVFIVALLVALAAIAGIVAAANAVRTGAGFLAGFGIPAAMLVLFVAGPIALAAFNEDPVGSAFPTAVAVALAAITGMTIVAAVICALAVGPGSVSPAVYAAGGPRGAVAAVIACSGLIIFALVAVLGFAGFGIGEILKLSKKQVYLSLTIEAAFVFGGITTIMFLF